MRNDGAMTEKGEQMRNKILTVAGRMMAENGPENVSMREIAAKLRISKPVLYYYFKDKNSLVKTVFLDGAKHLDNVVRQVGSTEIPVEKKIEKILANHMEFCKLHPEAPKYFFNMLACPKNSVLHSLAEDFKKNNEQLLRKSFEKENLSCDIVDDMFRMLSGAIFQIFMETKYLGVRNMKQNTPSRFARIIVAGARQLKTIAIAFLISGFAVPAFAETITLEQAVNIALKDNTSIKNAISTHEMYDEMVNEYWGTVYPQISATGRYMHYLDDASAAGFDKKSKRSSRDNVFTGSIDVAQVLWAGGKVSTGIRMAKLYSASGGEKLRTAQKDTVKQVKQIYYSVLLAGKMIDIQKERLNLSKQYLNTIEAKYKQGISSDLELLRQKVEVSNNEPALTKAENTYEETLLKLKNLLGMQPDIEITPAGNLQCSSDKYSNPAELYEKALMNRPEYVDMKHQRDLYKEMVIIERAGHYPTLSAFASQAFQSQTDDLFPSSSQQAWNTTAGISLSLPIFSGGSVTSRTVQAQKQADIMSNNLNEMERNIKIAVKTAWLAFNEASSRLQSQSTAVEQARKALKATETRFKNGLSGLLELNDMALAFNTAQTLYSQAAHDTCSAKAQLEWTLGN